MPSDSAATVGFTWKAWALALAVPLLNPAVAAGDQEGRAATTITASPSVATARRSERIPPKTDTSPPSYDDAAVNEGSAPGADPLVPRWVTVVTSGPGPDGRPH